jgi:uncharacterized protein YecE (DUF72 family)
MAMIYAGTSGWSYASWKPKFYPAKLASAKFLEFYATRLNTVEVNYTFRHYASEKTLTNWIATTPPEFRFSVKAHQRITHITQLKGSPDLTRSFLGSLQPLLEAGRLGTVLFQLPPFLKADPARLEEFLGSLPRAIRVTFEFRHESWFTEQTFGILREHNAAICIAESEKLESPDVATADFCYYRLRKPEYKPSERKEIVRRAGKHLAAERDVFLYFKHEETPEGALYAEEVLSALRR